MTWDANNQVLSVALGGTTTTFAYDGAGTRVTKTSSGNTLAYVGKLFECLNPSGTTTPTCTQWTRYIYAGSTRIAQVISGGTPAYYESDHLGSTRVLSGAQTGTVSYQPFGLATSDSTTVRYKFTGQEWDAETGLYNYNARFYDPELGRFISADTVVPGVSPQALNRYAYVLNNALRYIDPTGHEISGVCYPHCPKQKSDPPRPMPSPDPSRDGDSILSRLWHGIVSALNGNGDPVGPPSWSTEELVGQLNSAMSVGASLVPFGSSEVAMSPCPTCSHGPLAFYRPTTNDLGGGTPYHRLQWRGPDFATFRVSVTIPTPWKSPLLRWTFSASIARHGQWHWSHIDPGLGSSPTALAASLTANWLIVDYQPGPTQLAAFLRRHGISGAGGYGRGAAVSFSPGNGAAFGLGPMTPQFGGNYSFSFKGPGNTGLNWSDYP